jgi:hypothetical protein
VDPGCLSRNPDPALFHPRCNNNKKEGGEICDLFLFQKISKNWENLFYFLKRTKKFEPVDQELQYFSSKNS